MRKKIEKKFPIFFSCLRKNYYYVRRIKILLIELLSYIFWLIPIKSNKIVIVSYSGKTFGDNGLYITKEILSRKLDYDVVWLVKKNLINKIEFLEGIRVVEYGSLQALFELGTSKIWIDNTRKTFFPKKRKNQFYIQTWHGGIALKKIEADAQGALDQYYQYIAKNDSKMADLFISNSKFISAIYKSSFWYKGEILESGYPRSDIFFGDLTNVRVKVRNHYGLDNNQKIVLYAPTFRKNGNVSCYNIDYEKLLSNLKSLGSDWRVLIRLHPNLIGINSNINFNERVLDATSYPDMQELIATSDMVITDYSSCMFDSAMLKIPTFIYATDISDYTSDRGMYFKMEELPFMLAENNDELLRNINKFDKKLYGENVDTFSETIGLIENGKASKIIVDYIKTVIGSNIYNGE